MGAGGWIDEVNAQGVRRVASTLGFSVEDAPRRGIRPCPGCDAAQRGSSDRRAAAEVTSDGGGWHCFRCDAKGGALTFAAWALLRTGTPSGDQWGELRERLTHEQPVRRPAQALPAPAGPVAPLRLPAEQLKAFWKACLPVTADDEVAAYLVSRRLSPDRIADFNLARALPRHVTADWASFKGASWAETTHRLIVPLFGATGAMESLHARALTKQDGIPKGLSPRGHGVAGLVMASALTRLMLSGAPLGDGSDSGEFVQRNGLVISEGVPDFLTWASHWSDAIECAPAVLGIISGSFTAEVAARIPSGCRIAIRQHADTGGEKFTNTILTNLADRCRTHVLRIEGST